MVVALWMEWLVREEEVVKAHNSLIGALARAGNPPDRKVRDEVNPWEGVMRSGSLGVNQ